MPEINRDAFPSVTDAIKKQIAADTKTIAAIHIDRMRVGKYKGIDLQGGMFYPAIKENLANGVVWAFNSTGTARGVARRAAANNGYVKLVLMQEGNVIGNKTFSHIWFNDLKESVANGSMKESKALRELNAVRKKYAKHPDSKLRTDHTETWKTLDQAFNDIVSMPQQKRALTYFQKSKTTTKAGEKIAYQSLLSQKMSKAGFPDAIKIVDSIEEPAFKNVPTGAAVGIIRIDPISDSDPILTGEQAGVPTHLSYDYVLKGKPVAKMTHYQVVDVAYPELKHKILSQQMTDFPVERSIPGKQESMGQVRYMPSSLTARDINAIAAEVGGGDVKGGAKAFGAFMRSMRDKGITLRDVVKSYGITLSSIQRQELPVSTIKKNWPDAPFQEGTKVRPEDAFAQLLGTPEGQKYLDAAERGVFDEQAADAVVQKFRSFGFHNKLKEQMKTAVEQFYPKAQEIIDAVNTMPTDQFIDYVRNNFKGISYGKVGFWSGQLGRGDIPTFDSRQGKLVYGKEVPVTKQVLMEQKDRLTQLGIKVPAAFKDFAQTLLHHEVWDRLNQSDTEHGPIKEAMLRYMPSDTDYLSAVQNGDTQAAQRMVDEAAKAAGYTVGPVYHGSAARFNQFKRNFLGTATGGQSANEAFFFSTSDRTARNYASYAAEEGPIKELMRKADQAEANGDWDLYDKLIGQAEELDIGRNAQALREQRRQQSKVYDVYLNGRFLEMDAEGKTPAELSSAKAFKQFDGSLTAALKAARRKGYDGVVFRNLDDAPNLSDPSDHYAIFDPNKIKLADPITRDDAGNVIPLSQRFKASSEDIRYMPAGDMASGRSVKDHREAMDLFEKGYRIYGALYDGMEDPVRLKKATEIERFDPENLWAVPPRRVAAAIAIRNMPADMMPQPDSSMPGAYSFPGGYRALPGKTKGSLRLYGPAGSLIGIAASLDEAQRILRRKSK